MTVRPEALKAEAAGDRTLWLGGPRGSGVVGDGDIVMESKGAHPRRMQEPFLTLRSVPLNPSSHPTPSPPTVHKCTVRAQKYILPAPDLIVCKCLDLLEPRRPTVPSHTNSL